MASLFTVVSPSTTNGALTMSSREIAELLGNRHDDVKRSIDRLADRGVIVRPPMADEPGVDSMGRPRPMKVYLLDKRSSLIVVAQLSPEFTARVVDRWQELEEQARNPHPLSISPCRHERPASCWPLFLCLFRGGFFAGGDTVATRP